MPIMVQISELGLSDSEGRQVFSDLHFRLNRGEWACIIGSKGAGKSSLFKLLSGQIRPDRGQILVDDRNVLRVSRDKLRLLRQRLGITVDPKILNNQRRTLSSTIAFKLNALNFAAEEVGDRTAKVLDLVEIADKAESTLPDLSECERQLFGLAIALCHDPVLLLIDDPLSAISDKKEWRRFLEVLERIHLRKRLTTLMLTSKKDPILDRFPIQRHVLVAGHIDAREVETEVSPAPAPTAVGGER